MIVGSAVGGGYDLFARIVARHIVHHIPGSPGIIVQNQPAAGGVVALAIGAIENAPETYTVDGRQYVLVTAEGPSIFTRMEHMEEAMKGR